MSDNVTGSVEYFLKHGLDFFINFKSIFLKRE